MTWTVSSTRATWAGDWLVFGGVLLHRRLLADQLLRTQVSDFKVRASRTSPSGTRSTSPSTWTSSEASSRRVEGAVGASGASAPCGNCTVCHRGWRQHDLVGGLNHWGILFHQRLHFNQQSIYVGQGRACQRRRPPSPEAPRRPAVRAACFFQKEKAGQPKVSVLSRVW